MKICRPINKKITPEKHDLFDNIEQVYKLVSSETEVSELV